MYIHIYMYTYICKYLDIIYIYEGEAAWVTHGGVSCMSPAWLYICAAYAILM